MQARATILSCLGERANPKGLLSYTERTLKLFINNNKCKQICKFDRMKLSNNYVP